MKSLVLLTLSFLIHCSSVYAFSDIDENQYGKIEAAMNEQIKGDLSQAKNTVEMLYNMQDEVAYLTRDKENFSDGRVKAIGSIIMEAELIKTQIDENSTNTKVNIDDQYKISKDLVQKLKILQMEAQKYLMEVM